MSTVIRTFSVKAPPGVVVPYLADFAHAEQWDPGTVTCVREGEGPVAVGASWRNTSKVGGITTELTYTLEQLSDTRIVLVGRNKTATSTETIDATPDGTGSRMSYRNDLTFNGLAKLATPAFRLLFEKLGNETRDNLVQVLDGLVA